MKKKYIPYRSGLLIGLLSLGTLSSCVNTRPELGMGPWPSKSSGNPENGGKDSKSGGNWKSDWAKKGFAIGTAGAIGAAAGTYGGYNAGYNNGYNDGRNSSISSSYSNNLSNSTGRGTMEGFNDPYGKRKK